MNIVNGEVIMAKKEKKEEVKEEIKEETAPKKKAVKEEKIPLIKLFNESTLKQSMMLGAIDFGGLLEEFTQDLINETEKCKISVDEFKEMIEKYQNRRL